MSRPHPVLKESLGAAVANCPVWQRCFDVIFALVGLFVLLPVMIVVGAAVWADLGRPVLFRQNRPGLRGSIFAIVKFRTMKPLETGRADESPDAERITKLGAFLRKTSLDELPELFGILRGDLSFVGPRPLLVEYLPFYTAIELQRFLVRPGLTGLAQVSGRNSLKWETRLALDVEWVQKMSPGMYLKILVRTLWVVLWAKGVEVDSYSVIKPLHIERAQARVSGGSMSTSSK